MEEKNSSNVGSIGSYCLLDGDTYPLKMKYMFWRNKVYNEKDFSQKPREKAEEK